MAPGAFPPPARSPVFSEGMRLVAAGMLAGTIAAVRLKESCENCSSKSALSISPSSTAVAVVLAA